ncbi:MAG: ABC transporter substrate-binding protein [Pseudomonadota bacterium]
MRSTVLKTLATVSTLAFTATAAFAADPVKIGAIGPFTGPAAQLGLETRQGLDFVMNDINEKDGLTIDGEMRTFEFIYEDSQSRPEVGVSAAQKLLTRDQVDILFHSLIHSSVALAAMELAPDFQDTLFLTGQNVSGQISEKIASDPARFANVWKPNFSSDAYAKTIYGTFSDLLDAGHIGEGKTIALIAEDTDYAKAVAKDTEALLASDGWKIPTQEFVAIGNADFFPQLSKLRASPPDVVLSIFTAPNAGIALVRQLQEQGIEVPHMAIPYPTQEEFLTGATDVMDGIISAPLQFDPVNNEEHKSFAERLAAIYPDTQITQNHGFAYCLGGLLFDAVERAGSLDIDKLNQAMLDTDFRCLLGRWVFNPDDHSPIVDGDHLAVPASQIQDGVHYAIWPEAVATSSYQP